MGYDFEWDPRKAAANLRKHGVTRRGGDLGVRRPVRDQPARPRAFARRGAVLVLGMSRATHLVVVAYAERGPRTRLISARRATRREWSQYEED